MHAHAVIGGHNVADARQAGVGNASGRLQAKLADPGADAFRREADDQARITFRRELPVFLMNGCRAH